MEEKKGKANNWFMNLSKGKKIALCTVVILVCFVIFVGSYVMSKLGKVEREQISKEKIVVNDLAEDVGVGYTNFAIFGVDSREGEIEKGTRTDCLIVASLNNATKEVKLVSVYRDTFLDLSDGILQKCNAAFSYGGAQQAINMLNMNLDLDIQDFVTVDFTSVSEVVDLLGGIEIELQEEEVQYLNEFIDETGQVAGKVANHITSAGLQTLDGVQATTYSRIRSTAGSDFTRTERQRRVIQKIAEKVVKSDLSTINKMIDQVLPKIKTSLSLTEILNYAKSFAKYTIGESTGFPIEKSTATIPGKGSIVIATDLVTNVQLLHQFLYGTVDYQPSSKVQSIAQAVKAELGVAASSGNKVPSATDTGHINNSSNTTNNSVNENFNHNSGNNSNTISGTGSQEKPVPTPSPEPEKPDPSPEPEKPTPKPEPEISTPDPEPEVPTPDPAPEPEKPIEPSIPDEGPGNEQAPS